MFTEAGAPKGVLNIVHGAHDVVNGLLDHDDVRGYFICWFPTSS